MGSITSPGFQRVSSRTPQWLIALSGCLKGEVSETLMEGKYELRAPPRAHSRRFSGPETSSSRYKTRAWRRRSASTPICSGWRRDGIPLVATNDSHYLCEDDSHAQDVMVCIQTGKSVHEENRLKFSTNQFFVRARRRCSGCSTGAEPLLRRTVEMPSAATSSWRRSAIRFPASRFPPDTPPTVTSSTWPARVLPAA